MPQQTLFGGWNLVRMTLDLDLPINQPGGRIAVRFEDENRRPAGGRTVQWRKPRDLSDIGHVLKDMGDVFMWAPQLECIAQLPLSFGRHCPEVPAAGQR
jgi:hypothetical protein